MLLTPLTGVIGAGAGRWLHPLCRPLATEKNGPFLEMPDGALGLVDSEGLRVSQDDGATWSDARPTCPGADLGHVGHVGQILRTRGCAADCAEGGTADRAGDGSLVLLYLNFQDYKFAWNDALGEPAPDCRLELWAARSLDGGETWVDRQCLLPGYNADFTGLLQTRDGRLVATVEHLAADPARWVVCSLWSEDDGRSWQRSNWIDLGGHGHHDGATEPSVIELRDGRLLMLIRTGLDRFWYAFSNDGGRSWRELRPGPLDASSAPGHLLRLRSGRIAVAWNRLCGEGSSVVPRASAPSPATTVPASWYREELSLALSEDEGETWTKPLVIAREPGGQLSYPYLYERHAGELWVFTRYTWDREHKPAPPLCVSVNEEALLKAAGG